MRQLRRRTPRTRERGGRLDDGAAAVEFALVLPILFLILFGIVDYGLFFGDALDTRAGVASATRQAVVDSFDPTCVGPKTVSQEVGELICMVEARTAALAGKTYVKVILPTDPKNTASTTTGWYPDGSMVVCEATDLGKGVTGYVPLPKNGVIRVRLVAQIEQHPTDATQPDAGGADATPPGGWDSWCTPAS